MSDPIGSALTLALTALDAWLMWQRGRAATAVERQEYSRVYQAASAADAKASEERLRAAVNTERERVQGMQHRRQTITADEVRRAGLGRDDV